MSDATQNGETPRTDAVVRRIWWDIDEQRHWGIDDDGEYVDADFARQLERELHAMQLRCASANRTADRALNEPSEARKER